MDRTYRVTDRFVLHLGTTCNARCGFCYYIDELRQGTARQVPEARLRRRIDLAARWGKTAVDLTGGEPTTRTDLCDIIRHCRRRAVDHVTVITNGLGTSRLDPCQRLQAAGLRDAIFSVHGHTGRMHDLHTGVPGSHRSAMRSMEHFHTLGLGLRINTVVTGRNFIHLAPMLESLAPLAPDELNLLVLNPSGGGARLPDADPFAIDDYHAVGSAISKALDLHRHRFPRVNVRFLPFCLLPNHPECVRTQWQKLHEDHEWDPVLHVIFQRGLAAAISATAAGTFLRGSGPVFRSVDWRTSAAHSLSRFRMHAYYHKGKPCVRCSVRRICTGLPRTWVARRGFPAVEPLELGVAVTDPLHFVKEQAGCFGSLREAARPASG